MIRLYELIEKLCPDGVEYKSLKELCSIKEKEAITKDDLGEGGEYPVINSSRDVLGYYSEYNNEPDTLVLTSHGAYAGFCHYMNERFFAGALCYPMQTTDDSIISTKFLYYLFKNNEALIRERFVNKSGVPYINFKGLMAHKVPVPPKPVQDEIVSILDTFTSLTAELQAELQARKIQYDEYVNILIEKGDFKENKKKPLNEIFDFRNGLSKGKEFFGKGIPFIRYTDVYNNRVLRASDLSALVECTDAEIEKLRVNKGDVLFTRTSETAEDVGWSSVLLDDVDQCVFNGFCIKASPKTDDLLPEYCAYCFSTRSFRQYVASHCAFTTRASLTGKTIGEYEMTIPSHEEQKAIVEVLDKLYLLCTDLSCGIPAEIEARQVQYEYYRNELLAFKELKVV